MAPSRPFRLDPAARGLVVGARAEPLSALEYRTLAFLLEREGQVVGRTELLDAVWEQRHAGSNVVDAVIRLLRKKLGPHASQLETVRGHGYRISPGTGPTRP
jgi:DNA-binding response OmpR family regulator